MMIRSGVAIALAVSLAGCATTGGDTAGAGGGSGTAGGAGAGSGASTAAVYTEFWTHEAPTADTIASMGLSNTETGSVTDPALGGVTFVAGTDSTGARGYVGINAGTSVGAEVSAGTATYTSDYRVVQLHNVAASAGEVTTDTRIESGSITLTADFGAGTLTGNQNDLRVAGQIVSTDFDGSVTYRDVLGDLKGEIGDDGVVGAFHGSDATSVYVGGFVGEKD